MSNTTGTATDYYDLLDKLNTFLTAAGTAFGMSYVGTGNGPIEGYRGGASSIAETFTITATSPTSFTVVGSTSGSIGPATVGTLFTHAKITFTINAGVTPFIAGDVFTLATAPKWTNQRRGGCLDERFHLGNLTNLENAFDGNLNTLATLALASNPTVGAHLALATTIVEFGWGISFTTGNGPTTIVLERSDDGSSWTTAATISGITWTAAQQYQRFAVSAGSHAYWRARATAGGSTIDCTEFGLYDVASSTANLAQCFYMNWLAPGNNGAQSIYIGAYTNANVASDYYNLIFTGSLGFTNLADKAQLNSSGRKALLLSNAAMKYWFVANGQRVQVIAKVSTTYHSAYLGLIYPYGSPAQYPLPFVIAADTSLLNYRWSTQNADCRFVIDPNTGFDLLDTSNTWRTYSNRTSAAVGDGSNDANGFNVHPAMKGDNGMLDYVRDNLGGGYTIIPVVPIARSPAPIVGIMGELDGLYWISGYSNASENTVSDAGFTHLIVQNIWRTQIQHYMAVRLD